MINNKLNDRVFDAMLEVACGEIMDDQIAGWDADNTVEHEFSPEFERKMKKLLRDHTREIRLKAARKALGRVAAVIIVIMALGFTITISVQALRVQFFNTIMELAEEYIGFTFSDNKEQPSDNILHPDYLPEGYREDNVEDLLSGTCITYINQDGNQIKLYQQLKREGLSVRIDNEHSKPPYSVVVSGVLVQIYESKSDGYDSFYVWEMEQSFYELSGSTDPAELIKIVESMLK